ncbi:MAG: glycosyltransferase [Planctomycetes bacterium]|nr:glycosyltransferase [Planctomycetota bacterium]
MSQEVIITTWPAIILTVYAGGCLLYWLRTLYGAIRVRRSIRRLSAERCPAPAVWPSLSVVVPACDEGDKIAAAAASLAAQGYPDLQLVFVDDRSTDDTGAIIDRLAAADGRVTAVRVGHLPEGWLGKVHALQRGLEAARGEFVLFTDADVHYQDGTLERAVAYMLRDRLDHLAAVPSLWPATFTTDLLIGQFIRQLLALFIPPWRIRDPRSKAFFGVGAFNMVRRKAFQATEGFAWLRMDTGDDMALGLMMKRAGGRCDVVWAGDLLGLHWYRTIREAMRGCEKAYASGANCRLRRMVLAAALLAGLELSPVVTPLLGLWPSLRVAGLVGMANLVVFALAAVLLARWARASVLRSLLTPLVTPVTAAMVLRAGLLGRLRGGIVWRGTLYPAAALRAGRRVKPL